MKLEDYFTPKEVLDFVPEVSSALSEDQKDFLRTLIKKGNFVLLESFFSEIIYIFEENELFSHEMANLRTKVHIILSHEGVSVDDISREIKISMITS